MDLAAALNDLAAWPISEIIRTSPWIYPVLETIHMIGLGLLFGGIFAFDLRLLGVHPDLSIKRMAAHLLPWVWVGFALNISSGVLLFLSDAATFGVNIAFRIKMLLILLAGLNALWFQFKVFPTTKPWDHDQPSPTNAKIIAVVSIFLWVLIITAGRMIAYSP